MNASGLRTNRDLYLFVCELLDRHSVSDRTLEEYLLALWRLVANRGRAEPLTVDEFACLLESAFHADVPSPLPEWFKRAAVSKQGWERTLAGQITDLRQMSQAGSLRDRYRYFGLDAPSGARWYNFDPLSYVECGVTGAFGGWRPGDGSERAYVPGLVGVMDADGNIETARPEDIDDPDHPLGEVSWERFDDFLTCGRLYE